MPEGSLQRRLFWTGVTGLTAFAILAGGIVWGLRLHPFHKSRILKVRFPTAAGINSGDGVFMNGISVGGVKKVELASHGVLMELRVPADLPLTTDMELVISGADLMGVRRIQIINGSGPPLTEAPESFRGSVEPDLLSGAAQLLPELQTLLHQLKDGAEAFLSWAGPGGATTQVTSLLEETGTLVRHLNRTLPPLVSELRAAGGRADSLLKDLRPSLRSALAELERAGQRGEMLLDTLRRDWSRQGSLQHLLQDSLFYHQTRTTLAHLDSLIQAIRTRGLLGFHKRGKK